MRRHVLLLMMLLYAALGAEAQEFFNLTAQEVRLDSVLPVFRHQLPLGAGYADSTYEVSIAYPEFLDMQAADVARYRAISGQPLPALPRIEQHLVVDRKQGGLAVSFVPLVFRDGRYQKLVSFMLKVEAKPLSRARKAEASASRYAAHSVLASGRWVKIRVPSTGVYHLSDALLRQAGFADASRVRVFGYGGALQPEALSGDYLARTDDLEEVPTCTVGSRRLFHAVGPVTWESPSATLRTRNYCSDYGYYFLTEGDVAPLVVDSATFVSAFYPDNDDYHALGETDNYAWYHSGRNLYNATPLSTTQAETYTLSSPGTKGTLSVAMSYNGYCEAGVWVNDSLVGNIVVSSETVKKSVSYFGANTTYSSEASYTWNFNLDGKLRSGSNTIALRQTSGSGTTMRTDHVTLTFPEPRPAPRLSADQLPVPEYVYEITNQDHHADEAVDMVILIPASQHLLEQALRLKTHHEQHDGLSVRIVPADELYNEFSSGTPDVSAYRRYMKMMYDRATTEAQLPRYLLLLGDGAWDNRMHIGQFAGCQPDNFLLCYESENSFSETYSYVGEDFFALLDDGEVLTNFRGKGDVAVGRMPARTPEEARIMVDKTINYALNAEAGAWQNTICVMADDGNVNQHMQDAESIVSAVSTVDDAFHINKVYWDMYRREASSTGNSYPEVERVLKQQMQDGALVMNYSGHGAAYCLSHELVLKLADFASAKSQGRLPLWVTASCDIAPFDTHEENIGETALLNPNGGAVAFLGTTRTVFMTANRRINQAFMRHVLGQTDGRRNAIGEALRLAKNDLVDNGSDISSNKLHYVLLGDPALVLASPTGRVTIDSIAGQTATDGQLVQLNAGEKVTISGHIEGQTSFNGVVSSMVLDKEETIVCRLNEPTPTASNETNYEFLMRPNVIYSGSDSVRGGRFSLTFVVPKDISYSTEAGQLLLYAVDDSKNREAHGQNTAFSLGGTAQIADDGIGPSVYCYLNDASFQNGGTVNSTPFFYASLTDKDGINAAGSGIGHDLELIIDGDMARTYTLNSYFQYDFGDYRSGTVGYSLPELAEGEHKLLFRAWDVLNNSSVAELSFTVDPHQQPSVASVICTRNPATTSTQFLIRHNRKGSQLDVTLEVFDASGRKLWSRSESGLSSSDTYTVDWDLTVSGGHRLQTGVYLYRVLVASGGSSEASVARKLIILAP